LRLRVGYAPSLAAGILSAAVEVFTQTHANARVELFDLSRKEMLAGLEDGTLDVIVTVSQSDRKSGWKWTPLVRAPWQLAVNRNHPLAARARVTPAEVAREPLLVFCQRDYPEYWVASRAGCARTGCALASLANTMEATVGRQVNESRTHIQRLPPACPLVSLIMRGCIAPEPRSAGFQTCCIADVQVGRSFPTRGGGYGNPRYSRLESLRYARAGEQCGLAHRREGRAP
jgi:DNA-binding transcriptional LysR family regulator